MKVREVITYKNYFEDFFKETNSKSSRQNYQSA